ncbi:MAG TPA: TonB-dependent receptor [Opitutaceae bacterium]|nr:TonB-dependent receptor [Opitutaceae bacterium]
MRARLAVLLTVAWPLVVTHGASAQILPAETQASDLADLSLEELMGYRIEKVFGASKYEQRVTRAPASVSIVTAADIQNYGHRTLSDVLRSMRGIFVSNDRNYDYTGVRGFLRPGDYNTRVLTLIDGHRVNDVVYDSVYFDRVNSVDIDWVERVELIRGPSSSIYGSSAFFGVINIVTRNAAQMNGGEFSAEAGSFGSYTARVGYGRQFSNNTDLVLNFSYFESEGEERLYFPEFDERISSESLARNHGVAEDADGERAMKFSATVRHGPFTFSGYFSTRRKAVPTASFATYFNDGREEAVDEIAFVDVKFEHEFSPDLRLVARAAVDHYGYSADYPYDFAEPGDPTDIVINKDSAHGDWFSTELQLTAKLRERHTIVVGGEFRYAFRQEQVSYYDTTPPEYFLDIDHSSHTMGFYAQGEFELHRKVLLNAGLRYDYYPNSFGGTLNPRLGLIYNPTARTTIKALYGQAFRAPNSYEQFYYTPFQGELEPERIRTAELVVEHYFGTDFSIGLSGYRYEVDNLINQFETEEGDLFFDNRDKTTAHGVEVELAGKFQSGIQARASFAVQRTEDATTGDELTSSPRQLGRFNISAPLAGERLRVGLEVQSHSSLVTLDGAKSGSFILTNLTFISRELTPGLELSASVYNLFDEDYGYPGAEDHTQDTIPQPGRSLRIKATFRF